MQSNSDSAKNIAMAKNILVLGVKVPFTSGGQEVLVRDLLRELKTRGHNADLLELPFAVWPKERILNQAAYWRTIDFDKLGGEKVDLIIATKFPTYFAAHAKKSIWLVHQHRMIYDLYGGRYTDFSDDPRDEALRALIQESDTRAISEADYISSISSNVAKRLADYNGIKSEVLYPPLPLAGKYQSAEPQDYILSVGRLCSIKRVDLMIKAMPIVHKHIKLKIVGTADEPGVMDYYKNEIAKHHLSDRIEFLGRVSNEDLVSLYSKALAVYYAPFNEDYGYVTLEAMASGRPVVTASDSGGVLEFVKDNENGLIAEPNTDSIGHSFNKLIEDIEFAKKLGAQGLNWINQSGLNSQGWDKIINALLSPLRD